MDEKDKNLISRRLAKAEEELLALLEDLEDAEEIHRLREAKEEAIPWAQAKAELQFEGLEAYLASVGGI
jgi:hypothetical protein